MIYGDDIREQIPYPKDIEMLSQVNSLISNIKLYAQVTDEDIHCIDWLFLISQSIYYLKTSNIQGKTNAANWVLENCNYVWCDSLKKAIKMRKKPYITKSYEDKMWLKNISIIIQLAAETLEIEKSKFMNANI